MNIYFDSEFTGLHQKTTLISIGLISECGKTFYAEFNDYDKTQINDWLQENIIDKLLLTDIQAKNGGRGGNTSVGYVGETSYIKESLLSWLSQFDKIEMWSDCLGYDWVLLNSLLTDYSCEYSKLPVHINYIPFDICTLFKIKNIDPDINREEFAEISEQYREDKHNSLFDAKVIKICYEKLIKMPSFIQES